MTALARLYDDHRAAFEYEWRTRFGVPWSAVGTPEMEYGEAWRLAGVLANDPGSMICASIQKWSYALPREALLLADLYDLQHTAKAKRRPTPYPRPWTLPRSTRRGSGRYTPEQLRRVIAAARASAESD